MKAIKILSLLILLSVFSYAETPPEDVRKEIQNELYIPEDDYYKSKKIEELEDKVDLLKTQNKYSKKMQTTINQLISELNNINSKTFNETEARKIRIIIEEVSSFNSFDLFDDNFDLDYVLNEISYNKILFEFRRIYESSEDSFTQHLITDTEKISTIIKSLKDYSEESLDKATKLEFTNNEKIQVYEKHIQKIIEAKGSQTKINKLAIKYGIPAFCVTIFALYLIPFAFKTNDSKSILEISTVFLLTTTILILGLANIINSEVLGTLLGGISAYVLNRSLNNRNNTNNNPVTNNHPE